jgi:FkbM family methyltransferase
MNLNREGSTIQQDIEPDDVSPFGSYASSIMDRVAWKACSWHALLNLPGKALWKTLGRRYPGPFDISVANMQLRIYPLANYGERIIAMQNRLPEISAMNLIRPYLKSGGIFVDVGANIGLYSIFASKIIGDDGKVVAIEPHPVTAKKLSYNLKTNQCKNVKLHRVAISTNDGNIDFWPDVGKNVGRSSVLKEAVGKAGDKITVNGRNLENLLNEEQVEAVDLVKIDVEGYEDQALIPFFKTASVGLFPKAVLLEIAHRKLWREDLVAMMKQLGYQETGGTKEIMLLVR